MKQFYTKVIEEILTQYQLISESLPESDINLSNLKITNIWEPLFLELFGISHAMQEKTLNWQCYDYLQGIEPLDTKFFNQSDALNFLQNPTLMQDDVVLTAFCIIDKYLHPGQREIFPGEDFYSELEDCFDYIRHQGKGLNDSEFLEFDFFDDYASVQYVLQGTNVIYKADGGQSFAVPNFLYRNTIDQCYRKRLTAYAEKQIDCARAVEQGGLFADKAQFEYAKLVPIDDRNAVSAFYLWHNQHNNKKMKSFSIPCWGYKYRLHTCIDVKSFPWACKADASQSKRYQFESSKRLWDKLFNKKDSSAIPSWYLFENNTGFNIASMIFSITYKENPQCLNEEFLESLVNYLPSFTNSPFVIGRIRALKVMILSLISLKTSLTYDENEYLKAFTNAFSQESKRFEKVLNEFINRLFCITSIEASSGKEALEKIHDWLAQKIKAEIYPKLDETVLDASQTEAKVIPEGLTRANDNQYFARVYHIVYSACSSLQSDYYFPLLKLLSD